MIRIGQLVLVVLAVMAIFCLPATSQADCHYGLGLSSLNAFGSSGTVYGLGMVPVPPYYAIHPPVYYGHRIYRTYGTSPIARHPSPARQITARARMILNPHVMQAHKQFELKSEPGDAPKPKDQPSKAEQKKVASAAQIIVNPYYHADAKLAASK